MTLDATLGAPARHERGAALSTTDPAPTAIAAAETPPTPAAWSATGLETPVFADPSGRRARAMSGVGLAVVMATVAAVVIVATAALGFTNLPAGLPFLRDLVPRAIAVSTLREERRELAVLDARDTRHGRSRYVVADRADVKRDSAEPIRKA